VDFLDTLMSFGFGENGAPTVSAVVITIGLIVAIAELFLLVWSTRRENYRRRQEYALSYSLIKNDTLVQARISLAKEFGNTTITCPPLALERLEAAWNGDEDKKIQTDLRTLLSHWENMALAIRNGVADEKTAFEMVGVRVICTFHQYRAYIDDRRKIGRASCRERV